VRAGQLANPADQGVITSQPLRMADRRLLFTIVETRTLEVTGMTCDHCASAVRSEISKLTGIATVEVDVPTGAVRIAGEPLPDEAALRAAVEEAGYNLAG
jgi:copper chaperone